ncbi:Z-ring formation inhibitor MciZ [Bacillus sp. BRMEA1]|nr:Z-ring formation inhibitor MciZ [Neobacillus endophyticus]NRD80649.1 Z-ring formation inhibitor MciZ [Neobacillus endophyticus]
MKVYVHEQGIILTGKGWEILQKLKEYNKDFIYVTDWIQKIALK